MQFQPSGPAHGCIEIESVLQDILTLLLARSPVEQNNTGAHTPIEGSVEVAAPPATRSRFEMPQTEAAGRLLPA
jgi:hypothetical protein